MFLQSPIEHSVKRKINGKNKTFNFSPGKAVEVDDTYGEALVKTYPQKYQEASAKKSSGLGNSARESLGTDETPAKKTTEEKLNVPAGFSKEQLAAKGIDELRGIAKEIGIGLTANAKVDTIINKILAGTSVPK